jgi:hypothetical protein
MKQIIVTAFFMGVSASSAITTYGCWCGGRDVTESFNKASAVFAGEVVEITEPLTADENAPLPGRFFTIKFKIEKSWKGVALVAREISVLSAQGHMDVLLIHQSARARDIWSMLMQPSAMLASKRVGAS